jgi:polysaccharide biosynthesis/export protein
LKHPGTCAKALLNFKHLGKLSQHSPNTGSEEETMGKSKIIASLLMVCIMAIVYGCSHPGSKVPSAEPMHSESPLPLTPYRIQPGDSLDIKFFYNPELNESLVVRPDGYISLQLVNEIMVAGLEPREVNEILTEKYSQELRKPVVTVIVKSFAGQRVYVGGEVDQQGLLVMPAGLTALQAVMQSGGFKNTAQPAETLVIRKGPDNRPIPLRVDLAAVLNGSTNGEDFRLQPDDILYVPKSSIARVNLFVNQYIEQLILFRGVSLGFSYEIKGDD